MTFATQAMALEIASWWPAAAEERNLPVPAPAEAATVDILLVALAMPRRGSALLLKEVPKAPVEMAAVRSSMVPPAIGDMVVGHARTSCRQPPAVAAVTVTTAAGPPVVVAEAEDLVSPLRREMLPSASARCAETAM